MVQELEANAERQRQVRRRHNATTVQQLPVGRRCNIDHHDLRSTKYYDEGSMNRECHYCQALGFKDENKGPQSKIYFGQLYCNQGRVILDRFPDFHQVSFCCFKILQGKQNTSATISGISILAWHLPV